MAAPKGNKYWTLRKKHGRDKAFTDADELYLKCCDYFDWVEDNPINVTQNSKAGLIVIPKDRPFTESGLCLFLGVNPEYFAKSNYKEKDFIRVITWARSVIKTQKFEGAASGIFNANIIARDLGLSDKKETDITSKGKSFNLKSLVDFDDGESET